MSRWGGSERDRERTRELERARASERSQQADQEREARLAQLTNKPSVVQLDGLVLLKLINHSKEAMPDVVSGQLLGLDVGGKLEVTNSFPFPAGLSEEQSDQYQIDMMRHLRTVNVDNNTVGWYQSAYLGTFFDQVTSENTCATPRHKQARSVALVSLLLRMLRLCLLLCRVCLMLSTPTRSTFPTAL